jgi:hypothetical protein
MGSGRGHRARRVCLVAAGACGVLAIAAPVRAQDDLGVPPPEIWRGRATSLVTSVEADREALLPVSDVFRFMAVEGDSVYETDRQTARASLFFPGNGILQGPNLACGTFGGQFPPEFAPVLDACTRFEYPMTANADASTPSAATEGRVALGAPTDPVSGEATGARAHAAPDGSSTFASMQDLRVLGVPGVGPVTILPLEQLELDSTILSVGDATSRTDQRIEAGSLIVESEAALSDVRLVGGLIRIGSIRSSSRITDDAKGVRTSAAGLEMSGVTVGGVPAQVTDDGLVIGSPSSGPLTQQLASALTQTLQGLGVELTLLDTEETEDDGNGQAVASAPGLLVSIGQELQGLPTIPGPLGDIDLSGMYVGSIQLGNTAASGGATNFADEVLPPVEVPPVDVGGPIVGSDGFSTDSGVGEAPAPTDEVASPPSADSPASPDLIRTLTDPFGGRLGFVYLCLMFAVLGLCVVPRLSFSARLPGPRP